MGASNSTQSSAAEGGGGGGGGGEPSERSPDRAGSYLQVVIEKHKRKKENLPRLPAASSPAGAALVACPCYIGCGAGEERGARGDAEAALAQVAPAAGDGLDIDAEEPARVEVYRFERVGACLSCGGAGVTRVERGAARGGRAARRAAAEVGAAARLAVAAPLHAALLALRCALQVCRDAAAGAAAAVSDYAWKPLLAVTYNAALQPALVFACAVSRGARAALRPACAALGDLSLAAAPLLRALRLVDVHYHCDCRREHPHQHRPRDLQ